jgi:hypothetical protein
MPSIKTIPAIAAYTGRRDATPVIAEWYSPKSGWHRCARQKRVSAAWLRKLHTNGITHVSLRISVRPLRTADFSVAELLASARKGAPQEEAMTEATPPKVTPQAVASILAEEIVKAGSERMPAAESALWSVAMRLGIEVDVQSRVGDLHDR